MKTIYIVIESLGGIPQHIVGVYEAKGDAQEAIDNMFDDLCHDWEMIESILYPASYLGGEP